MNNLLTSQKMRLWKSPRNSRQMIRKMGRPTSLKNQAETRNKRKNNNDNAARTQRAVLLLGL